MNIYGFYHVACMNHWRDVFNNQVEKINSTLVHKVFVSVVYENKDDLLYVKENIPDKFEIVKTSDNIKDYEFGILQYMQQLANEDRFYCFYLHTKGVSINESNKSFYHGAKDLDHLLKCVNSWREYMEYFLFNDTKSILKKLLHYDAVGVALEKSPTLHFSGNFWWSKSPYIKSLPRVTKSERHNAEYWIGNNNKGKLFSLCNIKGSYKTIIKKDEYTSCNK